MRLFRERLDAALSTSEARRARTDSVKAPSHEWRKASRSMRSYRLDP